MKNNKLFTNYKLKDRKINENIFFILCGGTISSISEFDEINNKSYLVVKNNLLKNNIKKIFIPKNEKIKIEIKNILNKFSENYSIKDIFKIINTIIINIDKSNIFVITGGTDTLVYYSCYIKYYLEMNHSHILKNKKIIFIYSYESIDKPFCDGISYLEYLSKIYNKKFSGFHTINNDFLSPVEYILKNHTSHREGIKTINNNYIKKKIK